MSPSVPDGVSDVLVDLWIKMAKGTALPRIERTPGKDGQYYQWLVLCYLSTLFMLARNSGTISVDDVLAGAGLPKRPDRVPADEFVAKVDAQLDKMLRTHENT